MRKQKRHGESTEETLQDTFRGDAGGSKSLARTAAAPANDVAGAQRSEAAQAGTIPAAAGTPSGGPGTGWDPWEIWQRYIEQPRRARGSTTKRKG